MLTYVISESPNTDKIYMSVHQDALPSHYEETFESLEAAKASRPNLDWREPDEEADGDVLAVAVEK
ncbi:MAG: hypothetical protein LC772_06600 [Chloroflexi bacterium]|nr:hypothetical protein [Chloroflexota bacterium]